MDEVWIEQTAYLAKLSLDATFKRQASALRNNRPPRNGAPAAGEPGDFETSLIGCLTEPIGAEYLKPITWNAFQERLTGQADLGGWIDVKGVWRHRYRLAVQKNSNPDWAYLSISAEGHPIYHIRGWLWGYECMLKKNWSDPTGRGMPAYFVSRPYRHPLELRRLLHFE